MASREPRMPPQAVIRAVELVRNGLALAYRKLVPGHVATMELLAAGWLTQAIHAAAELGVADALADRPRTGAELAARVGADEQALRRLLRLLISHGIFTERRDGRYALTPMARALRRDADVSLRDAALFFGSRSTGTTGRISSTRCAPVSRWAKRCTACRSSTTCGPTGNSARCSTTR